MTRPQLDTAIERNSSRAALVLRYLREHTLAPVERERTWTCLLGLYREMRELEVKREASSRLRFDAPKFYRLTPPQDDTTAVQLMRLAETAYRIDKARGKAK